MLHLSLAFNSINSLKVILHKEQRKQSRQLWMWQRWQKMKNLRCLSIFQFFLLVMVKFPLAEAGVGFYIAVLFKWTRISGGHKDTRVVVRHFQFLRHIYNRRNILRNNYARKFLSIKSSRIFPIYRYVFLYTQIPCQ